MSDSVEMTDRFWSFVRERHMIYLRRADGAPPPWTDDPVLGMYRFCNVYRELDRVTNWLRVHWREPHADDPDLWFAMVVARHMNNIPLLAALGGPPLPWDEERFLSVCGERQAAGEQIFGAAYMIGTRESRPKHEYVSDRVFWPLWQARERVRPQPGETLGQFFADVCTFYGIASFMAGQVIADSKHHGAMRWAPDWETFVAMGPGSRRGMNRLLGNPVKAQMREDYFRDRVLELRQHLEPRFRGEGWPLPDAQDTQNCLCEFDKYERAHAGEGRPKQRFAPPQP